MNGENQNNQPKVTVQIDPEWVRIIKAAKQIQFGEITIKVHEQRVELVSYTAKRKPQDDVDLPQVFDL